MIFFVARSTLKKQFFKGLAQNLPRTNFPIPIVLQDQFRVLSLICGSSLTNALDYMIF